MQLNTITLDPAEAETQYKEYLAASKLTGSEEDLLLKKLYFELKQGHPVLRLADALRATGLNEAGYPRLGIARADETRVSFTWSPPYTWDRGKGCVYYHGPRRNGPHGMKRAAVVPPGVYPVPDLTSKYPDVQTVVPNVPPRLRPDGGLGRYHILFEVEKWTLAPHKDPALLKEIGPGLFAVLAIWDLTDVEMLALSITRGDGSGGDPNGITRDDGITRRG